MTKIDLNDEVFLAEQDAISDQNAIYLYRKYGQQIVFQLSKLCIEDIIRLETQGIHLSPQDYLDLAM